MQFEILKNPGIDFYSGFRKTSQGGRVQFLKKWGPVTSNPGSATAEYTSLYTQSTKRWRRLSPREYHLSPGCTYIDTITDNPIIHKCQSVTDILHGHPRRTTVRGGFSAPSPRTSLVSGKLPTRLPVSPAPVMSTSKVAGLGRDSLMHYGGASSLCWSVDHTVLTSEHSNTYPVRDL